MMKSCRRVRPDPWISRFGRHDNRFSYSFGRVYALGRRSRGWVAVAGLLCVVAGLAVAQPIDGRAGRAPLADFAPPAGAARVRLVPRAIVPLTDDSARNWKAALSPAEPLFLYENLEYGFADVVMQAYAAAPAVAMSARTGTAAPGGPVDIVTYQAAGAAAPYLARPLWSPQQRRFFAAVIENGRSDVLSFDLPAGAWVDDPRRLAAERIVRTNVTRNPVGWEGHLAIDRRERFLLYVTDQNQGDIMIQDLRNGRPHGPARSLVATEAMEFAPSINADGSLVVYTVRGAERDQLYLVSPAAAVAARNRLPLPTTRLTRGDAAYSYGVFAGPQALVAYRGTSLVLLSLRTLRETVVAENVYLEEQPAVSADGRFLAYVRSEDGRRPLVVVDLQPVVAGSAARRFGPGPLGRGSASAPGQRAAADQPAGQVSALDLATVPGAESLRLFERPVWAPDGRSIVVEAFDGLRWNLYRLQFDRFETGAP